MAALSAIKSARFSPTLQLAMWNISGAHSHKSNYSYNNSLTVSISPDTLTTDMFLSTNHNNIMQASGTFSQTLSMNLRFSLNKNQTYPFLAAQSTLIVRPYPTYNQPTLGNSNLLLQQHQSNTNYQQHSAGFAWLLDTATHVNKQKMMLSLNSKVRIARISRESTTSARRLRCFGILADWFFGQVGALI